MIAAIFPRGKVVERIARMRNVIAELRSDNGQIRFPRTIEGNFDVTGKGRFHFLGTEVQNVRLPIIEQLNAGRAERKQQRNLKVISEKLN